MTDDKPKRVLKRWAKYPVQAITSIDEQTASYIADEAESTGVSKSEVMRDLLGEAIEARNEAISLTIERQAEVIVAEQTTKVEAQRVADAVERRFANRI